MPFVPISWLKEMVDVVPGSSADDVAAALVRVGLEEEGVHGAGVTGPLVVGKVLSIVNEPQSNGKTIRYCRVDVGPDLNDPAGVSASDKGKEFPASRGIVCGAHNFEVGDLVPVVLPGAVLPGPFPITARKTYGHVSDGMICSQRELGLGDDHSGIIVLTRMGLSADALTPGQDAIELLGLGEQTLEVTVTPDRGYCFSMRGVAREYSHSTGAEYRDPAAAITVQTVGSTPGGFPVEIDDHAPIRARAGCDRFVARVVRGIDAMAPTPAWMRKRLTDSGMRPICLAVDVTNYVMLELGQPIGIYDAAKVDGPIVVRRARAGEVVRTLDGQDHSLHSEDLLITDSPGLTHGGKKGTRVLALAGVMGGESSEVVETTTEVLIEAAHFDPVTIARTARRHRLGSEASKRFERGTDTAIPPIAAQRVVDLIIEFGGGVADPESTDLDTTPDPVAISMPEGFPDAIVGVEYAPGEVLATLLSIGCAVMEKGGKLAVVPPSWRPDLRTPIDLVEEVARLHGYAELPSVLPVAPPGRGLTHSQKVRRSVARALAARGLTEVLTYPFISEQRLRDMMVGGPEDWRRKTIRLANPLDEAKPFLRTAVLETIFDAAAVNMSRGVTNLAIFEIGCAYLNEGTGVAPRPHVTKRPTAAQIAELDRALPSQPRHVVGLFYGNRLRHSWDTRPVPYDWTDAVAAAMEVARAAGLTFDLSPGEATPFHPGRTAKLTLNMGPDKPAQCVAYAGELHPKAIENFGLPARACGFAVALDPVIEASEDVLVRAVPVQTTPLAKEDFAFVVDRQLPAGELVATVREAAGVLCEDVRVFDVYVGEQIGEGKKSIALTVSLRAADHTISSEELLEVRTAVIAAAEKAHGARLR
jgi:phenylalanyl-tRNA synthetase beta chain